MRVSPGLLSPLVLSGNCLCHRFRVNQRKRCSSRLQPDGGLPPAQTSGPTIFGAETLQPKETAREVKRLERGARARLPSLLPPGALSGPATVPRTWPRDLGSLESCNPAKNSLLTQSPWTQWQRVLRKRLIMIRTKKCF